MGKKSTIELNGKRYNAVTGAVLGESKAHKSVMDFKKYEPRNHSGRVLDGFKPISPSNIARKTNEFVKPMKTVSSNVKSSIKQMDMVNVKRAGQSMASIYAVHKPQHANTLMRSAVKKPNLTSKATVKAQLPASQSAKALNPVIPNRDVLKVDPSRMQRARNSVKSSYVKKFGTAASQPVATAAIKSQTPIPTQTHENNQQDEDIFEAAIGQATSHEQKAPKIRVRRSPLKKIMNSLAVVCAALVIAVFVAYLNMPNIELHFASARAGFHATLPGYKSLGFSLDGPISSTNGVVAMSFQSGDSHFTLTQQASNWDNQTLLDSTTYQTDVPPKVLQSNGRTIYVSAGNHATWVSGGIRYDISGNSNLNDQQITSIADSM